MARTLSAVDKITRRNLRARESRAAAALAAHRKICGDCHPNSAWPRNACDAGWQLAKAATRAANDLAVFTGDIAGDQLAGQMPLV